MVTEDPNTVKGLLEAYEEGNLDFPDLVHLIVERSQEIGPQEVKDPSEETWTDGEQIPGPDNGTWINLFVSLGVLTYRQGRYINDAVNSALGFSGE